ncbi:MAG TPA: hypothetical protein VI216_07115 [Candidatus Acidoferrales bacterium]
MTLKTSTNTMNIAGGTQQLANGPTDLASRWKEARLVYPLYAAFASHFDLSPLPYPPGELPPARPTRSVFDSDLKWLDAVDEKVLAYQMRQIPSEILNASEESLRALIHRQLRKANKSDTDRDKIDLLLVQYFVLCASPDLVHKEVTLRDVARLLQPVLGESDVIPLEWCEPLEQILEKIRNCSSLSDMLEEGLVEQGRMLKESAGHLFYDPAALVAFCRFNFLVRRGFIRILHADLAAMRQAIDSLEAKGMKTVDCRSAGFSAAETTSKLRHFCENWRQPFQKDYTESSVRRAFEQLLALRADLEDALGIRDSTTNPDLSVASSGGKEILGAVNSNEARGIPSLSKSAPKEIALENRPEPKLKQARPELSSSIAATASVPKHDAVGISPKTPTAPAGVVDPGKCLEAIWEQLIAAPPSRGRSMSTVVLQDTKVLLSSWEVTAFVNEGGQEAEDLRRAVVARALLALASDRRKRSGDEGALAAALVLAQAEVSYFQGRVEQAKRAKNTEAAVNLGISTKRLLSFIEEAEKLRS